MLAGFIESRFVGSNHAFHQHCRIFVQTDILRSLMHIQEMTHTMSRSVPVSHTFFPQELTGKSIQLAAACSFREYGRTKSYMAFQYQRIVMAFFFCRSAQSHRTGDVGCSVEILCTRINQQQAFGLQLGSRLLRSRIVHDSSVFLVSRNHFKALTTIQRTFRTEFDGLCSNVQFVDTACGYSLFQPHIEFYQRHAVAFHCLVCAFNLHFVLDSLWQSHRWSGVNHATVKNPAGHRIARLVRVEHNGHIFQLAEKILKSVVRQHVDMARFQIFGCLCIHFARINEQHIAVLGNIGVGNGNRVVVHVVAADIENPGNFIESWKQQGFRTLLLHLGQHTFNLALRAFAGVLHLVFKNRTQRQFRTVFVNALKRIEIGCKAETAFSTELLQTTSLNQWEQTSINGQHIVFTQMFGKPFVDSRLARHIFLI